jgi:hypothetical protein
MAALSGACDGGALMARGRLIAEVISYCFWRYGSPRRCSLGRTRFSSKPVDPNADILARISAKSIDENKTGSVFGSDVFLGFVEWILGMREQFRHGLDVVEAGFVAIDLHRFLVSVFQNVDSYRGGLVFLAFFVDVLFGRDVDVHRASVDREEMQAAYPVSRDFEFAVFVVSEDFGFRDPIGSAAEEETPLGRVIELRFDFVFLDFARVSFFDFDFLIFFHWIFPLFHGFRLFYH